LRELRVALGSPFAPRWDIGGFPESGRSASIAEWPLSTQRDQFDPAPSPAKQALNRNDVGCEAGDLGDAYA